MQRVDPHGHSIRAIVTFLAAFGLLSASYGIGGSSQNAPAQATYLCPPMC